MVGRSIKLQLQGDRPGSIRDFTALVLAAVLLVSCVHPEASGVDVPEVRPFQRLTSLIAIIASPHGYDQQPVAVIGVAVLIGHEKVLYLTERDAELGVISNSVRLDLPPGKFAKLERPGGIVAEYLMVRGKFVEYTAAHERQYPGYITDIVDVGFSEEWSRDINDR